MIVVLDNTVLSNFALAQIASVIFMLWGDQVCTTPDVISEYHAGIMSAGLPASAWKSLQIQKLSSAEIEFAASLSAKLGKGECSCLAHCAFKKRHIGNR
jgi:predicted nucleic acid-binding protein